MATSTTLNPEQRRQRARLAALTRWSKEDPQLSAVRAQAGLLARFRREIAATHPDLPPAELDRRAEAARRAHMTRLAFVSSKARAARKTRAGVA